MRFSLKALLLISTWAAWLFGTLNFGHDWLVLPFVLTQYLLLAICLTLAVVASGRIRLLAVCFASGFIAWHLHLAVESLSTDMSMHRYSVSGSAVDKIGDWICKSNSIPDAKTNIEHYKMVATIVRAALGTISGAVTYLAVCLLVLNRNHEDA